MSKITTERYYKITLSNGSTYYGRTTIGNQRYRNHLSTVRQGSHHNKNVQESYDRYGSDDWVHEWLGYETGDRHHHNKIEFGYVQSDPKSINIDDGRKSLLSKEQINEQDRLRLQRKIDNMTPEELKEYRLITALKETHRRANETPEQREKRLKGMRDYRKRRRNL